MLRIQGPEGRSTSSRIPAVGLVLALGLAAGGCSADFRKLENPSLAPGERAPLPSATLSTRRNAGAPITQEAWPDSGARGALPPVTANPRPAFDNGPTGSPPLPNTAGLSKPFDRPKAATPAAPAAGAKAPVPSGRTVEVQQGDSLYAIAKRHNVSIADLMDANGLKSPALKPGQKLALPQPSALRRPVKQGTQVAAAGNAIPPSIVTAPAAVPAPTQPAPPSPPAAAAAGEWTGTYTLKSGDSLYAIARTHKVKLADLQRVNNITDPTKVRPGTVLKVPGASDAPATAAVARPTDAPRAAPIAATPNPPAPAASAPSANGGAVTPRIINIQPSAPKQDGEAQVAAVTPVVPVAPAAPQAAPPAPATPSPAASAGKFLWPVKGQVIAGFGKRPDGAPNDGVNIAVPAGTEIRAAGDGVVAYSGSELKGYGNLILVRHDDGFVTAYAHASELLVKRGDTVKRGQVIAKAGQSGGVDKPQVHFEVRKDSQPIDPTPHMEKM